MKFGRNTVTGLDWFLSSWKSTVDPIKGDFIYWLDANGFPQLILRNRSAMTFCSDIGMMGFPQLTPNPVYTYASVFNEKEMRLHMNFLITQLSRGLLNFECMELKDHSTRLSDE